MSGFARVVALLALLGCGSGTSVATGVFSEIESAQALPVSLGSPFTLRVGQSAHLASESLTLRFHAVPEDSRCPVDVQCVWEGNAKLLFEVSKTGHAPATIALDTGRDPVARTTQREAEYLNYTFELLSLEPSRSEQQRGIPQERYTARLVITAN